MKKMLALIGLCLIASGLRGYGQGLTAVEKAYIVSRFCTEVKYNFAFTPAFDWDSLCAASMPELAATATDEQFLKGLQALSAKLADGHTFVFALNNPGNPADWVRPLPMRTKRIGDSVFVTDVYSSELQKAGIERGVELLAIDGEPVIGYAAAHISPCLASSTPQWSAHRPFAEFELTKDKGGKVSKFLFKNKQGREITIVTDRNIPWDLASANPVLQFRMLDGGVGLLRIASFQDSDFSRALFDELYEEALKADALIIDVRDNGGGNSEHADYVISHFTDRPIPQGKWSTPMYIAAHASWGWPRERYEHAGDSIQPAQGKQAYLKPMALLANTSTFSSAENFCVSFKAAKRGVIVGEPTGGSTGNPIFIDLGGGIGACICTKHELDADGNEFVGIGIQPDIVAHENAGALRGGKDNVIETALEALGRRPQK